MKVLVTLLILVLLPFSVSVDAGVKFETYNASDLTWNDVDTTGWDWGWDSIGSLIDSVDISDAYLTITNASDFVSWTAADVVTPRKLNHDTLREYIVGLDTVISLHRIECDTCITSWVYNDSSFVRIDSISCDTVFRIRYEDVWAPKVQVFLDSLRWQELMRILEH